MKPVISVIVPVYNVEKYLADCLDSILLQSFGNIEVICVDDGSTDSSSDILAEYAKKDERVVVLHQSNQGLSVARNAGIENAHGEYICFVDSDDMLVPGALELLAGVIWKDKVDVVSYEMASLIYETEELRYITNKDVYYTVKNEYPGIMRGREFFVRMIENNDFVDSACLLLIRLAWLKSEEISFCPGMLFEDSAFVVQCCFASERMMHLKEKLYRYRVRENSIMTGKYSFHYIYSRIWLFSECLRIIYTLAGNERERKALSIHAKTILDGIRYTGAFLDGNELEKVGQLDSLYSLYADCMSLGEMNYNKEIILEGLIALIKNYSSVILYGAGMVGSKMHEFVKCNGFEDRILGFAVSGRPAESEKNGIVLGFIGDYEPSDEILVIISAKESSHRDMYQMACQYGFSKICAVSYMMECEIDRWFAKKEKESIAGDVR